MGGLSRRGFLLTTVGTATSAAATAALTMGPLDAVAGVRAASGAAPAAEPVVAYLHQGAVDEVTLMVGTRQVRSRDPELVRRLKRAAQ